MLFAAGDLPSGGVGGATRFWPLPLSARASLAGPPARRPGPLALRRWRPVAWAAVPALPRASLGRWVRFLRLAADAPEAHSGSATHPPTPGTLGPGPGRSAPAPEKASLVAAPGPLRLSHTDCNRLPRLFLCTSTMFTPAGNPSHSTPATSFGPARAGKSPGRFPRRRWLEAPFVGR